MSVLFANTDTFKICSPEVSLLPSDHNKTSPNTSNQIQMGCFLACLGFEKSRKRRKQPVKRSSPSASAQEPACYGRYVPLDSEFQSPVGPDIAGDYISGYGDELREKRRGPSLSKVKKKVRFNLDVKVYEPIISDDDYGEEDTEWESIASVCYKENSLPTSKRPEPSPANRYQNCRGDYEDEEEDDEFRFDENELSFDDSDEEAYDAYVSDSGDDNIPSKENLNPVVAIEDNKSTQLVGIDVRARDRGRFVSNVLNPVENVTQWKAVKRKAEFKCQEEENWGLKQEGLGQNLLSTKSGSEDLLVFKKVGSPGGAEGTIAVNVSLSNWLGSVGTKTKNSSPGQDRGNTDEKIQSRNS